MLTLHPTLRENVILYQNNYKYLVFVLRLVTFDHLTTDTSIGTRDLIEEYVLINAISTRVRLNI